MSLTPIQALWLHTLVRNKDLLGDMKPHWSLVNIVEDESCYNLFQTQWVDGILHVVVAPLTHLPRIEQVEMLQRILASVHWILSKREHVLLRPEAGETMDQLCSYLRCVPTMDANPDVRWRKMQMLYYRFELPYQDLEDRPSCRICHGRVATGAGAHLSSTDRAVNDGVSYRPDIHNECYRYARLVLLPIARAQRQLEKQKATAESDK